MSFNTPLDCIKFLLSLGFDHHPMVNDLIDDIHYQVVIFYQNHPTSPSLWSEFQSKISPKLNLLQSYLGGYTL